MESEETPQGSKATPEIGRNEPCPCGSKKKYKRCCGMNAAPKLSTPTQMPHPMAGAGGTPAFDPSQMDPQMMLQMSQMLGRLPKGQLQKLQNLMQRAMSGKDVTREAKEFEQSLPVEFQSMLASFQLPGQMPGMPGMPGAEAAPGANPEVLPALPAGDAANGGMTEEEARRIVETAAKEGKISTDKAQDLLSQPPSSDPTKEAKGVSKLWKKFSGK